jgi:hypothetical protein
LKETVVSRRGRSPSICLGAKKNLEETCQDRRCPGEDSNRPPSEYKTKLLFTTWTCCVLRYCMTREFVVYACRLVLVG